MKHLMIDLETMGTAINAPVLAIGAVYFDPKTGELGDRFYEAIDIEDACRYGRASGGTIKFWLKQSEEARKAVIAGTNEAKPVFERFRAFCLKHGSDVCVWGNGACFDISMLDYAFQKILQLRSPWEFWNVRDCRTIKDIANTAGLSYDVDRSGTHHQALDDAIYQAQWVSHYWQGLNGLTAAPAAAMTPELEDLL